MESNVMRSIVIGVDVGGTNTDAVLIQVGTSSPSIVSSAKTSTTSDVTRGVQIAITKALIQANPAKDNLFDIRQVNIGTTHFVNAFVQRKSLTKVAVFRLCGPASRALPPFSDFDDELRECIEGKVFMVNGGYEFDGKFITPVDNSEILRCVEECKSANIHNYVVCGVFSPVKKQQEDVVKGLIIKNDTLASVTVSHEIGQIGLLERENAALLNECLKPLCQKTVEGFRKALSELDLSCPFYLTQNDGTILDVDAALQHPVFTLASGPTNSMRGAAFLSTLQEAIVVDIGGTTTDIGILNKGFPREASTEVKVGGIRTNFRMPDVLSIGLGGGSYITKTASGAVKVGPLSAGYNIENEAFIFGIGEERKLTATDVSVAHGICSIGTPEHVSHLDAEFVSDVVREIRTMVEGVIDQMKISAEDLPVILVGGGSILIDSSQKLKGASELIKPQHSEVANAVGAALGQVSGSVDHVVSLMDFVDEKESQSAVENFIVDQKGKEEAEKTARKTMFEKAREIALKQGTDAAINAAVQKGARIDTVHVIDVSDTPLAYLPGNATRIQVKTVGDLKVDTGTVHLIDHVPSDFFAIRRGENHQTYNHHLSTHAVTASGEHLDQNISDKCQTQVCIDKITGEWILSEWDADCIAIGAGILGCGGGGSPYLGKLLIKIALRKGKQIRVISPEMFLEMSDPDRDLVIPISMMGAPLIISEKLSAKETLSSVKGMQMLYTDENYLNKTFDKYPPDMVKTENGVTYINHYNRTRSTMLDESCGMGRRRIAALVSAEIGGLNAMEPLLVGAEMNLPVIDSDGMGRAFPELQMYTPLIYGADPHPACLADEKGRMDVVLHAESGKALENHFRNIVVEMGCSSAVVISCLSQKEVMEKLVPYSLSRAWKLGDTVLSARAKHISPVDAILNECKGEKVITGKICDVRRETTGGFDRGFVRIAGTDEYNGKRVLVEFQNENLVVRMAEGCDSYAHVPIACVPDLIVIVDKDTGEPIPTENTRYGQRVVVMVLPSHQMLRSEQALKNVGPQAFGYPDSVKFSPHGSAHDVKSVAGLGK